MKFSYLSRLTSLLILSAISTCTFATGLMYEGGEHTSIGDDVKVRFAAEQLPINHAAFTLTNGAQATYGEILALGDFYGIPASPISAGSTPADREKRFVVAFQQLDLLPASATESKLLIEVLHKELNYVEAAIAKGEPAKSAFKRVSDNSDREFNCITGGGCGPATWWVSPGRATHLAETNYDHFGNAAWLAYEAGHQAAMNEAILANTTGDLSHLRTAYAMNAFASHFLSDIFASGHLREPRKELSDHVTPTSVGNLLAKYMHDEDGDGLSVHNANGESWRAYGDGYYFDQVNKTNRQHLTATMQRSADEIFTAYQTGQPVESQAVHNMVPMPDEMNGICHGDVAAMFYWDAEQKTIMRRSILSDVHSCKWVGSWVGIVTAIELVKIKGIPLSLQGEIARSDYAEQAVENGMITDTNVINYVKAKRM